MAAVASPFATTHLEARQRAQHYLDGRLAGGAGKRDNRPFTVPEINIASSFSTSLEDRKAVAAQIRDACTNTGFFYITGHGVPEATRQRVIAAAEQFFKTLPPSKKEELHVRHSKYLRGWESPDSSYVNPADWDNAEQVPETKEGFNWAYEDGLDPSRADGKYVEMDGEKVNGNVWPSEEDLPGFYAAIRDYYETILGLGRHLQRLFALSLDLPETFFDAMTTHAPNVARILYYPAARNPQPPDSSQTTDEIGLGAHTDYECFTILLGSGVPGLELLSPDNEWVSAPAVEGSFIINVADFMMRWTNDYYKSTVHRVVNRTSEERFSVPIFFSTNYDQVIETMPKFITPENPLKYPPIRAGEYVLERLRATMKEE